MTNGTGQEVRSDDDIIAFFFEDYAKALGGLRARVLACAEATRRGGLSSSVEERYAIKRLADAVCELAKVVFCC